MNRGLASTARAVRLPRAGVIVISTSMHQIHHITSLNLSILFVKLDIYFYKHACSRKRYVATCGFNRRNDEFPGLFRCNEV